MQYPVSEIFSSLQGEGMFAGQLSVFVRFQYCNLTCSWCDTKYTWLKKSGSYSEYSLSRLKKIITDSAPGHVILTGGEPVLQPLDRLFNKKKTWQVETNGTIRPDKKVSLTLSDGTVIKRDAMKPGVVKDLHWTVSPKLSNSRQDPEAVHYRYWAGLPRHNFKFIIQKKSDLKEIDKIVKKHKLDPGKVFAGIEGRDVESQLQAPMVEAVLKAGYNYSPRLHVLLWPGRRKK